MKMIKCDVCGRIVRENQAGLLNFAQGSGADLVYLDNSEGDDYDYVDETHKDLCRECGVKIMSILYPNRTFLNEEQYKELKQKK